MQIISNAIFAIASTTTHFGLNYAKINENGIETNMNDDFISILGSLPNVSIAINCSTQCTK